MTSIERELTSWSMKHKRDKLDNVLEIVYIYIKSFS